MTRLQPPDIAGIAEHLKAYDAELTAKTGCSLKQIACRAAAVDETIFARRAAGTRIGVVPLSTGRGIIAGFCDAVAGIAMHLGCRAFVTRRMDAAGLAEAFEGKADILMLADDDCFAAIDIRSRRVSRNAQATGRGFAQGLELMAGGVKNRAVLVIGCGPVGGAAALWLCRRGVQVCLYDIVERNCHDLAATLSRLTGSKACIAGQLEPALADQQLIIDACPAGGIIDADHITASTWISAPGVPLGLTAAARVKLAQRLLHDPLQIGVATMIADTVKFKLSADER